ncbi:MAG TPA: hypothetical protein VMW83_12985 [Spirochaetia bacterium]|nr:hypothetical protein [Spirochaetia bacterium]
MKDIIETLDDYIDEKNPSRLAKLSSNIQFRRLTLTLLREILRELRQLNANREK